MDDQTIVAIVDDDGVVVNAAALGLLDSDVKKVVRFKSGMYARIFAGKGKHSRIANRICDGQPDLYVPALMCQMVDFCDEIDGRPSKLWRRIAMEDFDDMPLPDYTRLIGAMGESFT